MDDATLRFNLIAMLIQNREYNTRTVEDLMRDADKLINYAKLGGQPVRVLN